MNIPAAHISTRPHRNQRRGHRDVALSRCASMPLQALHLGGNRITEPADLEKLGCLTALLELSLAGNPLTRKQTYRALLISKLPRLYSADGQVRHCIAPGSKRPIDRHLASLGAHYQKQEEKVTSPPSSHCAGCGVCSPVGARWIKHDRKISFMKWVVIMFQH